MGSALLLSSEDLLPHLYCLLAQHITYRSRLDIRRPYLVAKISILAYIVRNLRQTGAGGVKQGTKAMVYCGRPAAGCQPCRQRRTKCDLLKPRCGQCIRTKRACFGYREPHDGIFRDQSFEIARRFQGPACFDMTGVPEQQQVMTRPSTLRQPTKATATSDLTFWPMVQKQPGPDIGADYILGYMSGMVESPGDRATNFFVLNHVIGNARSFRYLQSFYESGGMDDHLSATIRAVGFASMSKTVRSSKLEHYARKEYVSALRLTNAALQSYDLATRDSTLSAVMLLDFFEKVIHPRHRTLADWSGHLNGAATLMKLRGQKQFRTKIGLQLFTQMGADILLGCMQRGIPLPDDYVTLRASAVKFLDTADPAWRLSEVTVRYIGLRTALQDDSLTNPDAIILAVTELDKAMVSILDTLPPEWQYETISVQSDLLYEPQIQVYNDYRITEAVNMIRAGRVPLLELIQEQCCIGSSSPSPSFMILDYDKHLQLATDGIQKMASEISATVAQQAGYIPLLGLSSTSSTSMFTAQHKTTRDACRAGAFSLIWPLYVIGRSPSTDVSLRLWIIRQLRFVGSSMEIEQAAEVAGYLEGVEDIDVWTIFSMLGNVAYFADEH